MKSPCKSGKRRSRTTNHCRKIKSPKKSSPKKRAGSCPKGKRRSRTSKRCGTPSKPKCNSGRRRSPKTGRCNVTPAKKHYSIQRRSPGRPKNKSPPMSSVKLVAPGTVKLGNDGFYKASIDSKGRQSWRRCSASRNGRVNCGKRSGSGSILKGKSGQVLDLFSPVLIQGPERKQIEFSPSTKSNSSDLIPVVSRSSRSERKQIEPSRQGPLMLTGPPPKAPPPRLAIKDSNRVRRESTPNSVFKQDISTIFDDPRFEGKSTKEPKSWWDTIFGIDQRYQRK